MSDLRALGSEKLQGQAKLQRILELATWNEKKPNPVNEVSSSEYKITLADGNEYQIVKEKLGYIIKKTINEGNTDYIESMQNRRYLNSYSQALKKMNLMAKEYNTLYENEEGTSLFSEQKKFVLKTPKSEKKNNISEPTPPVDTPPVEEPTLPPPPPMSEPAIPSDISGDMPSDDISSDISSETEPSDETETDMEMDIEDTEPEPSGDVSFKLIQKLVGKLGQKIRQYSENNEISDKDAKYIINSVLSSIDLTKIGDETKEEIISKLEGIEADEEIDQMEEPTDVESEEEPELEGEETPEEMGETWDKIAGNLASQRVSRGVFNQAFPKEMKEDQDIIDSFAENIFKESKVDKILESYFKPSKNETMTIQNEIIRLSETTKQKNVAKLFTKKNPEFKLLGKTNKNNLVFESKNKQVKITMNGTIL